MTNKHIPILVKEVLETFEPCKEGVVLDGTLGGAGHAEALLTAYPHLKIFGSDQDENALTLAKIRLQKFNDRIEYFHGNFVEAVKSPVFWDGILLDLGFSSNQLEAKDYGLSFQNDAFLDMRLCRPAQGKTAWEILCETTDQELAEILKTYGEIPGSHRISRKIHEGIFGGKIHNSTLSLARSLESLSFLRHSSRTHHPATLVFQALRIAVNNELENLDRFLKAVTIKLKPKARVAILTFHSLEDRIIKRWAKDKNMRAVYKKPLLPTDQERKQNPRARSAKLRVYEA